MDIGELTERTGVDAHTIRHYEKAGLISKPARSSGSIRSYDLDDVKTIRFIVRARGLGFSFEDVQKLLNLPNDFSNSSESVREIALQNIEELDMKINELSAIRDALVDTITNSSDNLSSEELVMNSTLDYSSIYRRFF